MHTALRVTLMLALLGGIAAAAEEQPPEDTPPAVLTIASPRTSLLAGEPLVLHVALENRGGERLWMFPFNEESALEDDAVQAKIMVPGAEAFAGLSPILHKDMFHTSRFVIPIAGKLRFTMVLKECAGAPGNLAFGVPGDYVIEISMRVVHEMKGIVLPVTSNSLNIAVAAPPANCAGVSKLWERGSYAALREQYPNTIYGQYSRYFAGLGPAAGYERPEGPWPDAAVSILEKLVEGSPDFPLRDRAMMAIAALLWLSPKPESHEWLKRVAKQYPDSPAGARATEILALAATPEGAREASLRMGAMQNLTLSGILIERIPPESG